MPSGYTAAIADGIDFKTFAMDCARAFGACITLRDGAPGGDQIPAEFEPDAFYAKQLENAEREFTRINLLSTDQLQIEADAEFEAAEASRIKRVNEANALLAKYRAMLIAVEAWTPPTDGHKELKQFMRNQIMESINFDCDTSYMKPCERMTADKWSQDKRRTLFGNINRYADEYRKEIDRARNRTEWVQALRKSLES